MYKIVILILLPFLSFGRQVVEFSENDIAEQPSNKMEVALGWGIQNYIHLQYNYYIRTDKSFGINIGSYGYIHSGTFEFRKYWGKTDYPDVHRLFVAPSIGYITNEFTKNLYPLFNAGVGVRFYLAKNIGMSIDGGISYIYPQYWRDGCSSPIGICDGLMYSPLPNLRYQFFYRF